MNDRGIALPTILLFMLILAILAAIAVKSTIASLGVAARHKTELESFYRAEAGLTYAVAMIETQLDSGAIELNDATVTVNYPEPATIQKLSGGVPPFTTFSQAVLTKVPGTDRYSLRSTGLAGTSRTTLEIEVERETFAKYAVFGKDKVTIDNQANVYSYNSTVTKPILKDFPGASTKEGNIGSNTLLDLNNNAYVSGNLILGPAAEPLDAKKKATYISTETLTTEVTDPVNIDGLFKTYSKPENNNNDLIGEITEITGSITLPPGKYYFTKIDLPKDAEIKVTGPVKIFLDGKFDTKNNGCKINYETNAADAITTKPANLQIFSNSSEEIIVDNGNYFVGTIYAPKATVRTDHGSTFLGMIWANKAKVDNKANFMFDTALRSAMLKNKLYTKSWKQLSD